MPEKWKYAVLGIIFVLATTGFFTLKGVLFLDQSDPRTPPTPIPTATQPIEKVRLRVRSENKEPIPNVSVEFAVSNGSSSTKLTDTGGYTDIEIPKGVGVEIYLKHRDYDPQNYIVNSEVEPGKTKEFTLKLRARADSRSIPILPAPDHPSTPSTYGEVPLPTAKSDYVDGAPSSSKPLVERLTAEHPIVRQSSPSLVGQQQQQSGTGQQQQSGTGQQQQSGNGQQQQSGTGQQQQSGTGQQQQQ